MNVAEEFAVDLSEDIVRVYLKDVGRIPVMTAPEEREISIDIDVAETKQRNILFSIPQAVDELAHIGKWLENGSTTIIDV